MSSAIELYKEAYDLDFNKGDISYAEVLYKELIERFPHSDEKEYAQIHLERIAKLKGNPKDPAYTPPGNGSTGGALAVVCFVLILLILVALGFAGYYGYRCYRRIDSCEIVIRGLLSEQCGDRANAVQYYELAQKIFPESPLPFHSLANLYLTSGKLQQAELVGKQWALLHPDDPSLKLFQEQLADSLQQKNRK